MDKYCQVVMAIMQLSWRQCYGDGNGDNVVELGKVPWGRG